MAFLHREGYSMEVRKAEPKDMQLLGHIMAISFSSAFSAFVSQQLLDACAQEDNCAALLENVFRTGEMNFLIGGKSGMLVWQLTEQGAEIVAIHSLPESWGSGLGKAMLAAALEEIGDRPVYLWAFKENKRARRFYEKNGFRFDGSERVSDYEGAIEVRYVRGERNE